MKSLIPTAVYLLCLLTSAACAALLVRAWRRSRTRLLAWTAASFVLLTLNNLALVADLIVFPQVYLVPLRQLSAALAIGVLLYGFIWEVDE